MIYYCRIEQHFIYIMNEKQWICKHVFYPSFLSVLSYQKTVIEVRCSAKAIIYSNQRTCCCSYINVFSKISSFVIYLFYFNVFCSWYKRYLINEYILSVAYVTKPWCLLLCHTYSTYWWRIILSRLCYVLKNKCHAYGSNNCRVKQWITSLRCF